MALQSAAIAPPSVGSPSPPSCIEPTLRKSLTFSAPSLNRSSAAHSSVRALARHLDFSMSAVLCTVLRPLLHQGYSAHPAAQSIISRKRFRNTRHIWIRVAWGVVHTRFIWENIGRKVERGDDDDGGVRERAKLRTTRVRNESPRAAHHLQPQSRVHLY